MKKQMTTLTLALSMLVPLTSFAGGNSGGGGGGICLENNKCITLAEAGFRIDITEDQRSPLITDELIDELTNVLSLLPPQLSLKVEAVLGTDIRYGEIKTAEVSDQRKQDVFLKAYKDILMKNGSTELADKVELMAFTTKDVWYKTYLIKGKFDTLSLRGQALTLIHEYYLRIGFPLKDVLSADGIFIDYLSAVESGKRPDMIGMIKIYEKFVGVANSDSYYPSKDSQAYYLNEALIGKEPLKVESSDFEARYMRPGSEAKFSIRAIAKLKRTYPKFRYIKEDQTINLDASFRSFLLDEFLDSLVWEKEHKKFITISNTKFDEYIRSKNIDRSVYDVCADENDESVYIVANTKEGNLSKPIYVDCKFYPETLFMPRRFEQDIYQKIKSSMHGSKLKLEKELKCQYLYSSGLFICK